MCRYHWHLSVHIISGHKYECDLLQMYWLPRMNWVLRYIGAGVWGGGMSAENSNVRGEEVSLSVMEGPRHCHTNNTCSQKLDTCHQMSNLLIVPIPDKPQASCSYAGCWQLFSCYSQLMSKKSGLQIIFPFLQLDVQENEGRRGRSVSQSEKLVVLSYLTSFD